MQLIKECVWVINKPCVRGTRYMRLISWTLRSGSEHEYDDIFFGIRLNFALSCISQKFIYDIIHITVL